ncbi:MAG: DUF484 family protein [Burkholderiales bacterium]|nr:DUF484 family protein [Burkholderiales bacterium]
MNPMNPITEDDIANYLVHTPDFFERHAQLLSSVQLTSPHGNRAVSLQERQAEMLREKIKALEHRIMDMIRNGNENLIIADKLQRWMRSMLLAREPRQLPSVIIEQFREQFLVPQAAIKVWGVSEAYAAESFAQGASDDARSFASSLTSPFCGLNSGFEPASWLQDPNAAISLALLPLREAGAPQAFGLIVLASPDPQRFNTEMGTDFLERIAELASAALGRLRG